MSARPVSSLVFLLLDQFTLISLASALEPLRMANQLSGQELYRWHTASLDGHPVWASDGVPVTPDGSITSVPPADTVIVCGGIGIQGTVTGELVKWLRSQARYSKRLGGICTGSWVLARAGLLDGFECSVPLKHMLGTQQPKLQEIVALMEANLEEPINLDELATYVALSRRQLERMFQKYLHCSPSRYYLRLRLIRARQLLKQTPISIVELAVLCGFISTPHFSKCYREYFGVPPSDERSATDSERSIVVKPIIHRQPVPAPMNPLEQARGESTFASVKRLKT
ncbi:GlxA family transcriptional regulator [Pseudomonas sp. 18175]|uniref:GlxA family transcriptional regulator n=1 Tax=Pseudomonas sp. 18175 TaxID=3390056 RepID=UPI003D1C1792